MNLEIATVHSQGSALLGRISVGNSFLGFDQEDAEVAIELDGLCQNCPSELLSDLLSCPIVEQHESDSHIQAVRIDGIRSRLCWVPGETSDFAAFRIDLPNHCINDINGKFYFYPSRSATAVVRNFGVFVAPTPIFYFHPNTLGSFVEFTLFNQSNRRLSVIEVILSFGEEEKEVSGFPCEIEAMSSMSSCFNIDEFETLISSLQVLAEKKPVKVVTLAKIRWEIEGVTESTIYQLPHFQTFAKKLIVSAEVVSDPPYLTNKLLKVRYNVVNQLIDFKKLCLKWTGSKAIYCLDPLWNFGKMELNSDSTCYLRFYPTQAGLMDFGGESLRLDLQFSPNQRVHTECVWKKNLFVEITENSD